MNIGNLNICFKDYREVVNNKTAVLFSGILKSIATYATLNKEKIKVLSNLGQEFGYAFQLNDDLADFYDIDSGKSAFQDLSENKYTYPLIVALNDSTDSQRRNIIRLINLKEFKQVKLEIEKYDGFNKARVERDTAVEKCIKMSKSLIRDKNLQYAENFLISTLKS